MWHEICKINISTKKHFICNTHFEDRFIGRKYLKANAVPSLHLISANQPQSNDISAPSDKADSENIDPTPFIDYENDPSKYEQTDILNVSNQNKKCYSGHAYTSIFKTDLTLEEFAIFEPPHKRQEFDGNVQSEVEQNAKKFEYYRKKILPLETENTKLKTENNKLKSEMVEYKSQRSWKLVKLLTI